VSGEGGGVLLCTSASTAKETGGALCELPLRSREEEEEVLMGWMRASERRANNKTRVRRKRELHARRTGLTL